MVLHIFMDDKVISYIPEHNYFLNWEAFLMNITRITDPWTVTARKALLFLSVIITYQFNECLLLLHSFVCCPGWCLSGISHNQHVLSLDVLCFPPGDNYRIPMHNQSDSVHAQPVSRTLIVSRGHSLIVRALYLLFLPLPPSHLLPLLLPLL